MKFTLLEGVQEVLSSLDGEEVNSISDTVESYQVATIFKSVYFDILNDLNLTEHETTFGLLASGDVSKPVLMTLPENVTRVNWIKYDRKESGDTNPDYEFVVFKPFHEFIEFQEYFRNDTTDVGSITVEGSNGDEFSVMYKTNEAPTWYTFFDNTKVLFDSYDSSVDATLQQSKTLCLGHVYPVFTLEDDFTPLLDPSQFRYYLHRAKVRAFAELKQTANQEASSEARRQKVITQKRKERIASRPNIYNAPRYGRK